MTNPGKTVAALLVLTIACSVAEADQHRQPLTIDDGDRISLPRAPVISPDGTAVAYVLGNRINVVGADGASRAVTVEGFNASAPRWSSDGSALIFVSDRSGTSQLWSLPVDGYGEATRLTGYEHGVASTNLSPDESRVLLEFATSDLQPGPAETSGPPPPFVVDRRQFKRDAGDGYRTAGDSDQVYVLDIGSGELEALTTGPYDASQPAWSPDGRTVVFVSNREDDPDATYRSDLWLVDVDGERTPKRLTDDDHAKHSPAFSPDGRHVAYIHGGDGVYGVQHIAIVPVAGGEARILTALLDRWVSGFEFSADGRWIYFSFDNAGASELARLRVSDGRIERLVSGNVNVSGFDVGRTPTLAVRLTNENDLPDLYRLRGRNLDRLTDVNRGYLDSVETGNKLKFAFTSTPGTIVETFITTPPGYEPGRRFPAILKIHGGPVGQFSWGYDFATQYLAANGYVVVEPNPRGSTGFGQDYIRAIYETWGITDYDDVIAAIDYAIDAGYADPERLAVTGYSYGGYMTNVVITETDRFRAAASGAGHSLIEANFGHDIYQQWYVWELGLPWENRPMYDRLSPFLRAGNVTTPTLFLGGRIDWNVPVLNAELMYQALKVRGVDAELVVYPDVHHGGWPAAYEKDYLERIVAWFDRYLE